jgi:hypothetical protein
MLLLHAVQRWRTHPLILVRGFSRTRRSCYVVEYVLNSPSTTLSGLRWLYSSSTHRTKFSPCALRF